MFTGIITELGTVKLVEKEEKIAHFLISAPETVKGKKIGDSIAVNGACMTITELNDQDFSFDCIEESLQKTNLGELKLGDKVNLEAALKFNQSLDGHIVQGHVDTRGIVEEVSKSEKNCTLTIAIPLEISKYISIKGSITINGVSLTVTKVQRERFSVELIPHTMEKTNLQFLKKGDKVNLEIDIIARYLERLTNYGN